MVAVILGDCIKVMRSMEENSADAVVADPPYLLEFMGQEFDSQHKTMPGSNDGQRMQAWHVRWATQALRVLKPGGYILAFGGERTYHRLMAALEDAGFEPRTTLLWLHAQGFPKSLDVTKAIEAMEWCGCEDRSENL